MKDLVQEGRNIQQIFKNNFHDTQSNELNEGPIFQKIRSLVSNIKNAFKSSDKSEFSGDVSSLNNLTSNLTNWGSKYEREYNTLGEKAMGEYSKILGIGSEKTPLSGVKLVIQNKEYVIKSIDGAELNLEVEIENFSNNTDIDSQLSNGALVFTIQDVNTGAEKRTRMSLGQFNKILDSTYSI